MNVSLSKDQFGQMELPFPKPKGELGWDRGRPTAMPNNGMSGYSQGHHQGRLYRIVDTAGGSKASEESGGLGLHWSHDLDAVKWWGENMEKPKIIEAAHPGYEHVMNYDKDRETLTRTTGFTEDRAHEMLPAEVPVRPGAPLQVMAVHHPVGQTGWRRTPREHRGMA
jgi:hypothetical protein